MVTIEPTPELRRNRDFNLLWTGQVLSDLGGRVSAIAFPLLVLATTGSPAKAGIVGAVGSLPILLLMLPSGALVDRWNRKNVMLTSDAIRLIAIASVAIAEATGQVTFWQLLIVAFADGAGFVFFNVAERASLRRVVSDEQMPAAITRNQAREYGSLLAGQPLGGALFGLGRAIPFAFDAISYAVSLVTVGAIRSDLGPGSREATRSVVKDLCEGMLWFWRQPFLRVTSLLVTGTDFTVNAAYLVVIVVARERGAPPALIGGMLVFLGLGGIVGSAVAPWLTPRLSARHVAILVPLWISSLLPALAFVPGKATPGVAFGAMFLLFPTWNAIVGSYRVRITPDHLQARVASIATLLSLGLVPVASVTTGFLLEQAGARPTVLCLLAVMVAVLISALTSASLRRVS